MSSNVVDALRQRLTWLRQKYQENRDEFLHDLDEEKIRGFQRMYYIIFTSGGLYLALAATVPVQVMEGVIPHSYYQGWMTVVITCPMLTLVGKSLTKRAAKKGPDDANAAVAAAWMQFAGDGGVWGAILIYIACIIDSTSWGDALFGAFFVLMGVPGGFMFTLRSWRRIHQIGQRGKKL